MKRPRFKQFIGSRFFITPVMSLSLFAVLAVLIIQIPFLPREYQYQISDKSVKTYFAPTDITYLDTIATEQAREKAASAVEEKFKVNDIVIKEVFDQRLGSFFQEVESGRRALADLKAIPEGAAPPDGSPSEDEVVTNTVAHLAKLLSEFPEALEYSGPDLSYWVTVDSRYSYLRLLLEAVLREELTKEPIRQGEVDTRRAAFRKIIRDQDITRQEADLLGSLGAVMIVENAIPDVQGTSQARDSARDAVVPVYGSVTKGQPYLKVGEKITQTHFDIWVALGIITEHGEAQRSKIATWMACFLLAIMFMVMVLYLDRFHSGALASVKFFGLFVLINLISGVTGLLLGLFFYQTGGDVINLVAMAVILNALLISQYYSNPLGMFNSILWAGLFAAFFNPSIFFPAAILSLLSCLLFRRDPSGKLLALQVLLNVLVAFFALAAIDLFRGGEGMEAFSVTNLEISLLIGLIPVALIVFLNILIDLVFNLPTATRLAEFANLNHPLLRRLQLEAPGTYHHSIMVGSIAELAGSAIGANPLLIRVGALYHDIGKEERPEFFAENQHKGSNIHNKYSPNLSKIIIENHVKDGIRLARRARLPEEVVALIPQHHGTTLITYFFRKALAISNGEPVNEHDFRYPGPKPQTAEAAALFMTDASESAVRALEEPTQHRIETVVNKIFEERLLDGQFNDCGLSMNQLRIMKASVITSLVAAYHHRVAYPDEAEMKREIEKGTSDEESET